MEIIIGILITCGVVYAVAIWLSRATKTMSIKSFSAIIGKIENLTPSQMYLTSKGDEGIAVDEERGKLCLIYGIANIENPVADVINQESKIYYFEDVLEAHILEDGIINHQISSTSQNKSIENKDIKSNDTKQKVKTVELNILINDENKTGHLIRFMEVDRPVEKNNSVYTDALEHAVYWQNLINGFIKNQDYSRKEPVNKKDSNNYVADEIIKLARLQEQGYISQEEFDLQKAKILKT